jgi:hypothetical protein
MSDRAQVNGSVSKNVRLILTVWRSPFTVHRSPFTVRRCSTAKYANGGEKGIQNLHEEITFLNPSFNNSARLSR